MSMFQLILLAIGGVILVCVYFISRKKPRAEPPYPSFEKQIPDSQLTEREPDTYEPNTIVDFNEVAEPSLPFDEEESIDVDDLDIAALFEKTQAAVVDGSPSNMIIAEAGVEDTIDSDATLQTQTPPPHTQQSINSAEQQSAETVAAKHNQTTILADNIVVLHIKSKQKDSFWGNTLLETLQDYQLQYGAMQVFHCHYQEQRIFTLVNMIEPGTFDLDKMPASRIKGLTAFMQLDKLQDVPAAFDHMIKTLGEIADILEASIFDRQHTILTNQSLDNLREAVMHYD